MVGPKDMSDDYRHDLQLFYKRPHEMEIKWVNEHIYPMTWGPFKGAQDIKEVENKGSGSGSGSGEQAANANAVMGTTLFQAK